MVAATRPSAASSSIGGKKTSPTRSSCGIRCIAKPPLEPGLAQASPINLVRLPCEIHQPLRHTTKCSEQANRVLALISRNAGLVGTDKRIFDLLFKSPQHHIEPRSKIGKICRLGML